MRAHEQVPEALPGVAERRRTPDHAAEAGHSFDANLDARAVLGLQRSVGNAAVAALISGGGTGRERTGRGPAVQRMAGDEDGIASRVRGRNAAGRTHSPRLREQLQAEGEAPAGGGPSRRTRDHARYSPYVEPKEKGIWDGRLRFTYYPATWDAVLAPLNEPSPGMYECPRCQQVVPKYDARNAKVNGITIDHKQNYRDWIWATAAPDSEGQITSDAAKDAYNDVTNLEAMCRDCNSSKNGEKGKYA